ncbi:MAG: hypothetical protein IKR91_00150, partial [Alloprevotella sp.]|nr:hypothetical protein [Alloprevotella sp.]
SRGTQPCPNPLSQTPRFCARKTGMKIFSENFGPKNARFLRFAERSDFQADTKFRLGFSFDF